MFTLSDAGSGLRLHAAESGAGVLARLVCECGQVLRQRDVDLSLESVRADSGSELIRLLRWDGLMLVRCTASIHGAGGKLVEGVHLGRRPARVFGHPWLAGDF